MEEDKVEKIKRKRNLWLFSGIMWTIVSLRNLSKYQTSLDFRLFALVGILSFICAYLVHRELV